MPSLNKVTVMGHLARDPEMKYTSSGTAVCNFTVAVSKKWKGEKGEKKEKTAWIRCTCFGGWAENSVNMKKGQLCLVQGELAQDTWEKDGKKQEKTYVNAQEVYALESKRSDAASSPPPRAATPPEGKLPDEDTDSQSCPF